jgi:membrane-bound serine protease (ClpP class)
VSAAQALELGVIDLIAANAPALLREVDGTSVTLADGSEVLLETTGVPIVDEGMGWFWGFLHALLNPNLAFIFFWLGLALLVSEFFVPGGIAGTIGGLMLVASIVALGMLPVQLLGVVLLIASVVFFILELQAPGIGAAALAGAASLLVGGWFLFEDTAQISPLVLLPVAAGATAFFLVVLRAAIRMRRSAVEMRDDTMAGREGTVIRDCDPVGVVQVASEEWSAESTGGFLVRGTRVRVVGVEKLKLLVEPLSQPSAAAAGDAEGRHS